MLTGRFPEAGEGDPDRLLAAYQDVLADVIAQQGVETIAAEADLDAATVESAPDDPDFELSTAAAILAVSPEFPDPEAILAEARDILLMGMTTAVMDVDAVAAELGGDLEPKEIQQKVEGRYPITLGEYARIHHLLEAR